MPAAEIVPPSGFEIVSSCPAGESAMRTTTAMRPPTTSSRITASAGHRYGLRAGPRHASESFERDPPLHRAAKRLLPPGARRAAGAVARVLALSIRLELSAPLPRAAAGR